MQRTSLDCRRKEIDFHDWSTKKRAYQIFKYILTILRLLNNMKRDFTIVIEQGEDGYFISDVVELPGCHSQAKTLNELIKRTKEAFSLYLEVTKDLQTEKFVGIQKVEV